MSLDPVQHYLAQYVSKANTASWLVQQQDQAVELIRSKGFPTRRLEEWKYTDVQPLLKQAFRFTGESTTTVAVDHTLAQIPDLDCYQMVFVNGRYSSGNLPGGSGVSVHSLQEALSDNNPLLRSHLNLYTAAGKNPFADLNTAFMQDGCVMLLADNTVLDKPLNLVYLSTRMDEPVASCPRNLLLLGKRAQATVIETYAGADQLDYFTNSVTEVSLDQGASLEHYKLQQEGSLACHIGNLQAEQKRDSRLVSHSISLGGKLVRNDIEVRLTEPGAHTVLNGLYMAANSQHVDNHTRIDHLCPHTSSNQTYRGVLSGRARGVFNGKVIVHKDAQKTSAHQSNANLLLSNDAEIDTKPELQIFADDVKCSHGATVGQLDENMLYYLRTRAIPEDLARSLLTFAFAGDVISRIALEPVRRLLQQRVLGQLPDADTIREFIG